MNTEIHYKFVNSIYIFFLFFLNTTLDRIKEDVLFVFGSYIYENKRLSYIHEPSRTFSRQCTRILGR